MPGWTLPTLEGPEPGRLAALPSCWPGPHHTGLAGWQGGSLLCCGSWSSWPGRPGPGPAHKEDRSRGSPCSPPLVPGCFLSVRGPFGARPRPPCLSGNPRVWQESSQAGLAAAGLWKGDGRKRVCMCGGRTCASMSVCACVCPGRT